METGDRRFEVDTIYLLARSRVEEAIVELRRLQIAAERLGVEGLAESVGKTLPMLEELSTFIREQQED